MNRYMDTVEAICTYDGKIEKIGTFEELQPFADEIVDLKGAVLFPGFVDTHMHVIAHGEKLVSLDLSTYSSVEMILEAVRQKVKETPHGEWVVGEGWNEGNFSEPTIIHRNELDAISTDHPIVLKRACRHAAIANTKALEIAGLLQQTEVENGKVVVDAEGSPTGYLLEAAHEVVLQKIPEPSTDFLEDVLARSIADLHALGLTGAITDDLGYYTSYKKPFEAYQRVVRKNKNFRAHLMRRSTTYEEIVAAQETYDEFVEEGPLKFFIDGALGGRTALLSESYADDPGNYGLAVLTDEEIEQLVCLARSNGDGVAIHMIGDVAVEKALNAVEKYPAAPGVLDRFIHVNVLRPDLIERMKKLPIVLDIQPKFVTSDFPWVMDRLGEERLPYAYAWRTLLDEGFICSAGSDAPIEEADPLLGIQAAIVRRKPFVETESYLEEQNLTHFEAVQLFTSYAAASLGKADHRGKIAVGFDADFTVLAEDIFNLRADKITEVAVEKTVVAGKIVYERE